MLLLDCKGAFLDWTGSRPATNGFSRDTKFIIDFVPEESCEQEVGSPPTCVSVALPITGQHPGAHTHPTLASICILRVESVTLSSAQWRSCLAWELLWKASRQHPHEWQTTYFEKGFPKCSNLAQLPLNSQLSQRWASWKKPSMGTIKHKFWTVSMLPLGRGGRREGIACPSARSTTPHTRLPLRDLLLFCPQHCVVAFSCQSCPSITTVTCWHHFIPSFCRNKLTRSQAARSQRIENFPAHSVRFFDDGFWYAWLPIH